jgi:hypothetical protein
MKHKGNNCKVCGGEKIITHNAGKNEWYEPCPECNKIKRFKTIQEAEDYYMENLAKNNEDEAGRDRWVESHTDEIDDRDGDFSGACGTNDR